MSPPIPAAVTGGSGFIGGELLHQLASHGGVRALFRTESAKSKAWAAQGCQPVFGDLDDTAALTELLRGVRTVYHCAAVMGKSDARLSHRVNVLGTENLIAAALQAGVERFMYISSISVYAATRLPGGTITEATEPECTDQLNAYGRTKYQGERSVHRLAGAARLPFTIIRPTNVYGPGSRPWFAQFEHMLRRLPVAIGDFPIDVVYVDDLVEGLIRAATTPAGANEVFHLGHEVVNMNQFITEVARVTGQRAWRLPPVADRLLRRGVDWTYRTATGTHMSLSLVRPARYPHTKASQAFGYAPGIRIPDGFARLAKWYETGGRR
jgi:nucleoside-diphosphate-sugar epimerase